jgi:hypothetical protein
MLSLFADRASSTLAFLALCNTVFDVMGRHKGGAIWRKAVRPVRSLVLNFLLFVRLGKVRVDEDANRVEQNWLLAAFWWKEKLIIDGRLKELLETIPTVLVAAWYADNVEEHLILMTANAASCLFVR